MAPAASIEPVRAIAGNAELLEELRERVARQCVVPFVGAGLSVPFDYPEWAGLLRSQGELYGLLDDVNNELAAGRYEEAAAVLVDSPHTGPVFQDLISIKFKPTRTLRDGPIGGAPRALAALVRGPVITTNYDEVLERVYEQQRRPFDAVVRPIDESMLCDAFSGNHHFLLKIHGHWSEPSSRILTLTEYERFYGASTAGEIDPTLRLPQALRLMFQGRSVLFLGCSLQEDRYLRMLRRLVADGLYTPLHFALLEDRGDMKERRRSLSRDRILPIFFPQGRFDLIETILEYLGMKREVTRSMRKETLELEPVSARRQRRESGGEEDLASRSFGGAPSGAPQAPRAEAPLQVPPAIHVSPPTIPTGLRDALVKRRCVGFIGSGASVDAGLPTWYQLAHDLITMTSEDGRLDADRIAALRAQVERGEMLEVLGVCMKYVPQRVHRAIATRFDAHGLDSPTHDLLAKVPFRALVTTNYDTFLETRRPGSQVLVPEAIAALGGDGEARLLDRADPLPILKIHGTAVEPAKIMFTAESYRRMMEQASGYREFLVQLFSRWTVFFYGTSYRDERVFELVEAAHQRAGATGPRHYGILMESAYVTPEEMRGRYGIEAIGAPEGLTPQQARALLRALGKG